MWSRVDKSGECWIWKARHLRAGYGQIYGAKQDWLTHRLAYVLASKEPIPDGFNVLHTCDNPPCCRNDDEGVYVVNGMEVKRWGHLFLGTILDNTADMVSKGRAKRGRGRPDFGTWLQRFPGYVHRRGEDAGAAKLTADNVREIRYRMAAGEITQKALARELGVCQMTISRIVRRERWNHID